LFHILSSLYIDSPHALSLQAAALFIVVVAGSLSLLETRRSLARSRTDIFVMGGLFSLWQHSTRTRYKAWPLGTFKTPQDWLGEDERFHSFLALPSSPFFASASYLNLSLEFSTSSLPSRKSSKGGFSISIFISNPKQRLINESLQNGSYASDDSSDGSSSIRSGINNTSGRLLLLLGIVESGIVAVEQKREGGRRGKGEEERSFSLERGSLRKSEE